MKLGVVCLMLAVVCVSKVQGQEPAKMAFSAIQNDVPGWGSCTSCAGGENDADVYWMAQYQTRPAKDRSSIEFYISATQPYSNALFWEKLGAQDWATKFTWDFWVYVDQASLGAQALEYDMFQFVDGVEYMFGTQCNYAKGSWEVWNQGAGTWIPSQLACQPFSPQVWHEVVWKMHRTSDGNMHFDSLTLDGILHTLNLVEPSGPLPMGWADDLGVQWQLDTASAPIAFHEWVDKVKLTIQ